MPAIDNAPDWGAVRELRVNARLVDNDHACLFVEWWGYDNMHPIHTAHITPGPFDTYHRAPGTVVLYETIIDTFIEIARDTTAQ